MKNRQNDGNDTLKMITDGTGWWDLTYVAWDVPAEAAWDELVVIDADLDLPDGWDAVDVLNRRGPQPEWGQGYHVHHPREGDHEDVWSAYEARLWAAYREARAAALVAPLIAGRLARRRGTAAPNAATMQGHARRWLAALPGARTDTEEDIRALQSDAIALARALMAELGDAVLLAGKYGEWMEINWQYCHGECFVLSSDGEWHIDGFYRHKDQPNEYRVDVGLASPALSFLEDIAVTDYTCWMLATIIHGKGDHAKGEIMTDPADPDSSDFDADRLPRR